MRRILITGATTPYGVALSKALLARDDVDLVVAVGREINPRGWRSHDPRYRYEVADLTRPRGIRKLLWGAARHVNSVVHAATHRSAHATGTRVHRLNVDGTRMLLALAEEHPAIRCFVFRSAASVYRVDARQPAIIDEHHRLNLSPHARQWVRDRIEADLTACTAMGMSRLSVSVLRMAECVAPDMGSQLHDYLEAPVCFRPLGFDPIMNVLSIADMVQATTLALGCAKQGLYNIPGRDTLPLSVLVRRWGRVAVPTPGFMMAPLYRARALLYGTEFRYDMNHLRFHFNGVLSGDRARAELGYLPKVGIDWPVGGALAAPSYAARGSRHQEASFDDNPDPVSRTLHDDSSSHGA